VPQTFGILFSDDDRKVQQLGALHHYGDSFSDFGKARELRAKCILHVDDD
jgi:hypothetical protein